ncbi:MAG: dihydrofolate reductase family protein [Atribacterota bacterium]|jgi:2,5-diamino-6-(ribosylamino)-4(3H)-pyrimidinone 5'-phosphate reductase|nr:dihydrofolate reductase family protein [Atribacterota bacterium]MDD4895615.1 dihydrofolate reductase family protein [Atribacterota bacterium]MDD5637271.1 dihydrofolate reductase family protein [Atribacterota bacterium]
MRIDCIIGMSLDARIDWIKNPQELQEIYYGIVIQSQYDGIICGSTTILDATYDENNTEKYSHQQLIVIDSKGKIKNWPIIKKQAWWNDKPIVFCSKETKTDYLNKLEEEDINYIVTGEHRVKLKDSLLIVEKKYGIQTLRIDSGGSLLGHMLREQLVDNIVTIIVPQMTGGMSPKNIFVANDLDNIDGVISLKLKDCKVIKKQYVVIKHEVQK